MSLDRPNAELSNAFGAKDTLVSLPVQTEAGSWHIISIVSLVELF